MRRRDFVKLTLGTAAAAGAPFVLSQLVRGAAAERLPIVALARNEKLFGPEDAIARPLLGSLLHESVKKATGESTPEAAWSSRFSKRDVVGIKVNCLAGARLWSHTKLVDAVIDGLRMAGVRDENILIWDRLSRELAGAGFTINRGRSGVQCFGTDSAYERSPEIQGSVGSCFSQIVTRKCTALVNVPVLKDHDLAGVSLGLKNFFGAINNPNKYHANNCDPYVADVNSVRHIRKKLRLIICDGLVAQCDGGPAYKPGRAWKYAGLLVGTDPVAVDWIGAQVIEKRRKKTGLPSLAKVNRPPKHILTAARAGLGIKDPSKTEVINI
ncbi:MAG: DUF362 domain-containing protein [Planctomycetes bacterium]|nr:DUF362 domain-containing protein [Planctomycetota bacterium]